MVAREDAERIHVETVAQWRAWLAANHDRGEGVWLVFWKRSTSRPALSYDEAITEAIAFGWVDGSSRSLDEERSALWFVARRPGSAWSRTNKERVATLEADGRMTDAGRRAVDEAKSNGMWTVLDGADRLIVPDDLAAALAARPGAREAWEAMTAGTRRAELTTLALAKRADTRERHVRRIVETLAGSEAKHGPHGLRER
jgi:uncharacterized protein YdeI (YjbR/CyaY-like superfamily)